MNESTRTTTDTLTSISTPTDTTPTPTSTTAATDSDTRPPVIKLMAALTAFRDPSWNAWRCALTALDGGPLTEEQAAIYRQHTGRTTLPSAPYREAYFIVGRGGGKNRAIALKAVEVSAFRGYRLAPR